MNKPIILSLYGVTLWITISRWYQAGNKGMPDPAVIGPATYLFAVLALAADFLEGLPVVLAAALTFILWQRAPARVASATGNTTTHPKGAPPGVRGPVGVQGRSVKQPSMNLGGPTGTQGPVGASGKPTG